MNRDLFIYYRIPNTEMDLGLQCAHRLLEEIQAEGLGLGELFRREEEGKPYITFMEVIHPDPVFETKINEFSAQIERLASKYFSELQNAPARHVEIFSKVNTPCA